MNILEYLNIEEQIVTPEKVVLSVKIADIHKQPFGLVHGGLSGLLIETACSIGANQHLHLPNFAVGVDLQVSHLSPASIGVLTVVATPEKVGRSLQFWCADVFLDENKKIASGKCLLANKKS